MSECRSHLGEYAANRGNCLNAGRIWASTPQIAEGTEDAEKPSESRKARRTRRTQDDCLKTKEP